MNANESVADVLHDVHVILNRDLDELARWMDTQRVPNAAAAAVRLEIIRKDLLEHIRLEEEGGLRHPVLEREAALNRLARELRDEHAQLLRSLDQLIHIARRGRRPAPEFHGNVQEWIGEMKRHETRENELFDQLSDVSDCC